MKRASFLLLLLVLTTTVVLTACQPQVVVENAPTTVIGTRLTTDPSATAAPSITPAATTQTQPDPTVRPTGTSGTASPSGTTDSSGTTAPSTLPGSGAPVIVVESDEFVPIPEALLADLTSALDDLVNNINRLEEPDPDLIETP
ncbi:MAG: hypothetical protein KBA30_10500 [Clostridia bacterium]|nr:hypothetical protein [Clostridia bacterium]